MRRLCVNGQDEEAKKALADTPDAVKIAEYAQRMANRATVPANQNGGFNEFARGRLNAFEEIIDMIQRTFHIRFTDEGWEYTE